MSVLPTEQSTSPVSETRHAALTHAIHLTRVHCHTKNKKQKLHTAGSVGKKQSHHCGHYGAIPALEEASG